MDRRGKHVSSQSIVSRPAADAAPRYYKWVADGKPIYGTGAYILDGGWNELPDSTPLVQCRSGFHVCRPDDVAHWCGTELYEVEITGETLAADDKMLCRRWRVIRTLKWDRRALSTE